MIRKAYGSVSTSVMRKADFILQNITVSWMNAHTPLSLGSRGADKDTFLAPPGERIAFTEYSIKSYVL